MSDLISRQATIKAIENLQDCYNGFSDTYDKACIIGVIEEVPPIEPIKHGRWEHYKTETLNDDIIGGEYRFKFFRCSECRFDVGGNSGFHYCPNCGAKMDEVEE